MEIYNEQIRDLPDAQRLGFFGAVAAGFRCLGFRGLGVEGLWGLGGCGV